MITKIVTKDLDGNTHIYRNTVYTYKEDIKVKCAKCGKPIVKSVSVQYTDVMSPDDREYLNVQKQKVQNETHICNQCVIKELQQESQEIDKSIYSNQLQEITDVQKQISELSSKVDKMVIDLNNELKNRIILYNENEYVINYVTHTTYPYSDVCWYCSRIDKRKPWYKTNSKNDIMIEAKPGHGKHLWENVILTNEKLADRYKKVKDAYEQFE